MYLDDSLQVGATFDQCLYSTQVTFNLLVSCGFIPNWKKSQLVPSQSITILGFLVNSVTMTISLPESKIRSMLELISGALSNPTMSIRHLAKLIGKLISCFPALPHGRMYYRALERFKNYSLGCNKYNFKVCVTLDPASLWCLAWWRRNVPDAVAPIRLLTNPSEIIFTDASSYAWGCYYDGNIAQGYFSPLELPLSINSKETLAIWYALRSFRQQLSDSHVLIQSDNTTAISYVAKKGGMQSELRDKISRDIWLLASEYNFDISISHIRGSDNLDADATSCLLSTHSEWSLPSHIFTQVYKVLGFRPDVDAFASQLNNKLPRYFSFTADPFSEHVDAFTICWSHTNLYCYPPCSVIGKCLRKIQQDKATVLFIAPFWPSQPWFPVWAQMLTSTPLLLLPPCPIFLPFTPGDRHPQKHRLALCFATISGRQCERDTFQKPLSKYSSKGSPPLLSNPTHLRSKPGRTFVVNDRLVCCNLLFPN